ncbi:MAG: hypothetical protein ACRDLO_03220 [Solirubrobacterales bacterium]
MPRRPRPDAPSAPARSPADTIVRLLALALAALTITTIPRTLVADLLTTAAWITLLASLLLTGLLLTRQARAPDTKRPRDPRSPPTGSEQRPVEQLDNEQPLADTSLDSNR